MKALLAVLVITCTGCFAGQRDAINADANYRLHQLDVQCQAHMTDWCMVQYQIVERNRAQELSDLEARRHHAAEILSHMGDGFQRGGSNPTVNCQTVQVGWYTQTQCQ